MDFQTTLAGYWLARDDFSQNTVNDYTVTFTRFARFIGDKDLTAITAIYADPAVVVVVPVAPGVGPRRRDCDRAAGSGTL